MNADLVQQMARATLAGTLPFPEIVGNLIAEGVEYYRIDYVAKQMSFYSGEGSVVVAPLAFENLPAVAAEFDGAALRAAILDSQRWTRVPAVLTSRRASGSTKLLCIPSWPTRHVSRAAR